MELHSQIPNDRQLFGLSTPVDGQEKTNALLNGLRVVSVTVDVLTADLRLQFERDVRLEVFNNSSGYEGWSAGFSAGGTPINVIGLGGGDLAFY